MNQQQHFGQQPVSTKSKLEHTWATRILSAILPFKVIVNCARDPYLVRWYLFRSGPVSIFIHKFVRSDEDRALHDHPWAFLVIPIWRGYIEHSFSKEPVPTPCPTCNGSCE